MSLDLRIVSDEEASKIETPPPIVVIVGPAKIGKSSFAAAFPKPIALWTERGMSCLPVPKLPVGGPVEKWDDLLKCLRFILKEKHDRKTIILDTIDIAQRLCQEYVIQESYHGCSKTYSAYGQGLVPMRMEFKRLLVGLEKCRDVKGMNVVVVAHSGLHKGDNTLGEDYKKMGGDMDSQCWARVRDWADQIGYALVQTKTIDKKVKQMGSDRYLVFDDHPGREAGCRAGYQMPPKIELSFSAYDAHMKERLSRGDN